MTEKFIIKICKELHELNVKTFLGLVTSLFLERCFFAVSMPSHHLLLSEIFIPASFPGSYFRCLRVDLAHDHHFGSFLLSGYIISRLENSYSPKSSFSFQIYAKTLKVVSLALASLLNSRIV